MGTKPFKEFNIDIFRLSAGKHRYHFEVNDAFFEEFEYSLLDKGSLSIDAELDKSETFIQVDFDIKGTIGLVCDRSLEEFDHPVSINERLIFKYGEEEGEIGDDIVMIPHGSMQINVAQYIYELISTAIPMKKLHPKLQEEEDEWDEADEFETLVYSDAEEEEEEENTSEESNEEEQIDPRWNALKNLMNKNNK